jgi:large subunit ribosomal protein L35
MIGCFISRILLQYYSQYFVNSPVFFMPKLRTKSAVKKRFNLTASGNLLATQANKKHFMRRRTKSQLRKLRGTTILEGQQVKNVKKFFIPYL